MKLSKENTSLLSIGVGFCIIALLSKNYYLFIPCGIAVFSYPFPQLKKIVHACWVKFGEVLGWVMQRIILSVLFYFVLTPIALLRRVFNKDFFQLKNKVQSSFKLRNKKYLSSDLEDMW